MKFAKYHGTANDFIMVEDLDDRLRLEAAVIEALCDRRRGVGADGLIRIVGADGADFSMDYYNADGAAAEMCGNGIRCLGKYVYDKGLVSSKEIDVQTRAGLKRLVIEDDAGVARLVRVDMGRPEFERRSIPMKGDPTTTFVGQRLEVDGRAFAATALSMGNPHCVLLLDPRDDLEGLDVGRLGPLVENRDEFPERTNVEFVKPSGDTLLARVWERGSGETMACGTGACAALVASSLAGLTAREADVEFPGGRLRLAWGEDDHVLLTGPATCVYEGELDETWLAQAARRDAS